MSQYPEDSHEGDPLKTSFALTVDPIRSGLFVNELSLRLHELQRSIDRQEKPKELSWGTQLIDLLKSALTGWPTLVILFLILFYRPIRDALNSIPEKVRSAEEIQMAGVSLKGAIKKEATRVGEIALSETIPRLSSSALEFLLQVPRGGDQLWSFSPDNVGNFRILWIANDDELNNIAELDRLGLVTLTMEKDPS